MDVIVREAEVIWGGVISTHPGPAHPGQLSVFPPPRPHLPPPSLASPGLLHSAMEK